MYPHNHLAWTTLAQRGETTRTTFGKNMSAPHKRRTFGIVTAGVRSFETCLHRLPLQKAEGMTYADQAATDRTVCGRLGGLYRNDRSGFAFLGRRTGIHSFSQANSLSQIAIPDFAGNGPRGFAASGCQWRLSDTIREWPRLTLAKQPSDGVC